MILTNHAKMKLRTLADFLEAKVKKEWFKIHIFFEQGFEEQKCGTRACALGWATQCFPDSLKLSYIHALPMVVLKNPKFLQIVESKSSLLDSSLLDSVDVSLVSGSKFFEIEYRLAWFLFMPGQYRYGVELDEVIRRLREVCDATPAQLEETLLNQDYLPAFTPRLFYYDNEENEND